MPSYRTPTYSRFIAKVVKTSTCWLFQGTPSQKYGQFNGTCASVWCNASSYLAHPSSSRLAQPRGVAWNSQTTNASGYGR